MAYEESRFFDAVDHDRQFTADNFAEYFRLFLSDGVWQGGTFLQVAANSGMNVQVNYGAAMVYGYGYWLKEDAGSIKTLAISAAEALPRIDRIVLRLDKSVGTRSTVLAVLKGTAASTPVAPALTRSGNIYEISLAQIAVAANAVSIASGDITDERSDIDVCGIVEPKAIRDYINQGVKTTSSPTFAAVTVTGTLQADKVIGAVYQ